MLADVVKNERADIEQQRDENIVNLATDREFWSRSVVRKSAAVLTN